MIFTQVLLSCPMMMAHLHSKLKHISFITNNNLEFMRRQASKQASKHNVWNYSSEESKNPFKNVWRIAMLHRPMFLHITFFLVLPKSNYNVHFHMRTLLQKWGAIY
jgi:hypothetical protein